MALIKGGRLATSPFTDASAADEIPATGAVIVSAEQWQAQREALLARGTPLGIKLRSDQSPELIEADLGHFALVALEFPKFRDGRAYSYARLLRERYGFEGELRAVGEVLLEQLFFMLRTGFDAFELSSADPEADYQTALADFSVWYQPTGDGRPTAMQLRLRGH
jgi:uncharacterized protein (DUF934 family)